MRSFLSIFRITLILLLLVTRGATFHSLLGQGEEINKELLGFPFRLIKDTLLCYSPEAKFISRGVTVLLSPKDFNRNNLISLFRFIALRYKRSEELTVNVFTNEQEMSQYLSLRPVDYKQAVTGSVTDKLGSTLSPYALFIRDRDNELFRYTVSESEAEATHVILKGTNPYFSEQLGFPFEIIKMGFVIDDGEVECHRREISILMQDKDFQEHNLAKLFSYLSSQYPYPKNLTTNVYTSFDQALQVNPFYCHRFKPQLNRAELEDKKSTGVPPRTAVFSKYEREAYFQYTIYPYVVNQYGGFEMKKVKVK